jgi:hypothetical protein
MASQKYYCNNCRINFIHGSTSIPICPSCASYNIVKIDDKPEGSIWESKLFFVSIIGMLLMLIVLALLPPFKKRYNIEVIKFPYQCKIKIIVKDGNKIIPFDKFNYSADSGNTFYPLNEFIFKTPQRVAVFVKDKNNHPIKSDNKDANAFDFYPKCDDPCDCRKVKIDTVVIVNKALIIRTSTPKCPIEYSVTGINGPFLKDSIFGIEKSTSFDIFIRNANCSIPVSYAHNPVLKPEVVRKYRAQQSQTYTTGEIFAVELIDKRIFPLGRDSYDDIINSVKENLKDVSPTGSVNISIVVETDGTVSDVKIVNGVALDYETRIKNIIKSFGNWTTGYKNGELVRTRVSMTISF